MTNKYGKLNSGWWMLVDNMEEVEMNLNHAISKNMLEHIGEVFRNGGYVAINEAGGYHTGELSDYSDVYEGDRFPKDKPASKEFESKINLKNKAFLRSELSIVEAQIASIKGFVNHSPQHADTKQGEINFLTFQSDRLKKHILEMSLGDS